MRDIYKAIDDIEKYIIDLDKKGWLWIIGFGIAFFMIYLVFFR